MKHWKQCAYNNQQPAFQQVWHAQLVAGTFSMPVVLQICTAA
eukprot:SAG11_NODE_13615_length_647_cov_1.027372_2_plen_41_part_01